MSKELNLKGKVNFLSLTGALFLLMLGDLSQQIGSSLYWALFFLLAVCTWLSSSKNLYNSSIFPTLRWQVKSLCFGVLLILASMTFSSLLNSNAAISTLKYLVKYVAFAVLGMIIFQSRIQAKFFFQSLRSTLLLLGVLFLISLFLQNDYFGIVRLVDGRVGLRQVYPGMLWLSSSVILTYNLLAYAARDQVKNALFLLLTLFFIFLDGSRTGLLLVLLNLSLVMWLVLVTKELKWMVIVKICIITTLSFLAISLIPPLINVFAREQNQFNSTLEFTVQDTNNKSYVKRIAAGDDYRKSMYKFALGQACKFSFFGSGLENSKFEMEGRPSLVIHNVYLQSLIELGLVGFVGFLLIYFPFFSVFESLKTNNRLSEVTIEHLGIVGIVFLYILKGFFHPISNEISVMGFFIMALAVLLSNSRGGKFYS